MIINKMPRVFTEEQKQRRKEYHNEWRLKNKEKIKEYCKKYGKEYRDNNKEKIAERLKLYKEKNKEKILDQNKKWRKSPNGKKLSLISAWKQRGVVSTDYNLLYDNYLKSTNCEECGVEYGKIGDGTGTFKCMDHSHETGLFRNYLCNTCNLRRR